MRKPRSTRKENLSLRGNKLTCLGYSVLGIRGVLLISLLSRFKLVGPDGSNYFASLEAQVGGSDPDDA